jgi:hypothetical protein
VNACKHENDCHFGTEWKSKISKMVIIYRFKRNKKMYAFPSFYLDLCGLVITIITKMCPLRQIKSGNNVKL